MALWISVPGSRPGHWVILSLAGLLGIVAANALTGFYRMKWAVFGLPEVRRVFLSVAAGAVLVFLVSRVWLGLPGGVCLAWFALAGVLLSGFRGSKSLCRDAVCLARKWRKPACIVVARTSTSSGVIKELTDMPGFGYRVVGVVDPDPHNAGALVWGRRVLGTPEDLPEILGRTRARCVVLVEPLEDPARIWQSIKEPGIRVMVVPQRGPVVPRSLALRDLLRREPVRVGLERIRAALRGKRVMITGAGGSIGREIAKRVSDFEPEAVILFERDETNLFRIEEEMAGAGIPFLGDVSQQEDVDGAMARWLPDVVFHAAAYKHVPMMEKYPQKAVRNNVLGSYTLARAALRWGVADFINISTDKAVQPSSVMGMTKRITEIIMASLAGAGETRFSSVRFGNVLGSRGSVVEIFEKRIAQGGPLAVTHRNMERFFMLVEEAVLLVLEAFAMGKEGLYILDMGKPVNIYEMAVEMIRAAGLVPHRDIPIVITGPRPGEKLSESLFWPGERASRVAGGKLFLVENPVALGPDDLEMWVSDLARQKDPDRLRALLRELSYIKPKEVFAI